MKTNTWLRAAALALVMGIGGVAFAAEPAPPAAAKVNINTADAATLAQLLDGIGMARAEAIVAYRKENGNFTSVEQLGDVKGIGDATLERNRERIQLK